MIGTTSAAIGVPNDQNYPATTFLARTGDSSPATNTEVQYTAAGNTSEKIFSFFANAAKISLGVVTGFGPSVGSIKDTANLTAQGINQAGSGIAKAATSATSGIKWGLAILVIGLGIWFIAPTLSLFRPRGN